MKETFSVEVMYKEELVDDCNILQDVAKIIMREIVDLNGVYGVIVDIKTTEEVIQEVLDKKIREKVYEQ
jgi:hypothetical protein